MNTTPVISAYFISFFALMFVFLSLRVILLRRRYRVDIGEAGHADLQRAIRVQSNFVEYVPITLLLLLAYELTGAKAWLIQSLGGVLILARALHFWGFGFHKGISFGRFWGISLNFLILISLAVLVLLPTF